jgi:hypothetical protein
MMEQVCCRERIEQWTCDVQLDMSIPTPLPANLEDAAGIDYDLVILRMHREDIEDYRLIRLLLRKS